MIIDAELGEALSPNEEEVARELARFIEHQVHTAYPAGQLARRDAHPKSHGCLRAEFRVERELSAELAQGVFVPGKSYAAWVRFSNGDSDVSRSDTRGDSRGMAIKLVGVPGEKLLPEERNEQTQDFLLIDYPTFVVDDPEQYFAMLRRSDSTNPIVRLAAPLAIGLQGALIGFEITHRTIANPLGVRYWSTTPYRLGDERHKQAVKYSARPRNVTAHLPSAHLPSAHLPKDAGPNFLREALVRALENADAEFDFLVQPRTSPEMNVERCAREWDESEAPFHKVATLVIPKQRFDTPARDAFGEHLSFTPWHALPEHRPLGSVNRTRRVVYETISRLRHSLNAAPRREPSVEDGLD